MTGDLNGDGVVNRRDLAYFRPIDDVVTLTQGADSFRELTTRLLQDTADLSGDGLALSGLSPFPVTLSDGLALPATLAGRCVVGGYGVLDEEKWLQSWNQYNYLWADQSTSPVPTGLGSTTDYFDLLTGAQLPGAAGQRDRFSSAGPVPPTPPVPATPPTPPTPPGGGSLLGNILSGVVNSITPQLVTIADITSALDDLGISLDDIGVHLDDFGAAADAISVTTVGYGAGFKMVSRALPRDIRAVYVQAGSAAATAGITRGSKIVSVDGVDVLNGPADATDLDTALAALLNPVAGASHVFGVVDPVTNAQSTVTLVASAIAKSSLQQLKVLTTATGNVGYLALADLASGSAVLSSVPDFSELPQLATLISSVDEQLATDGISDLVVDMRYYTGNPGFPGSAIGATLASMIAGPARVANQVFAAEAYSRYVTTDLNPYLSTIGYRFFALSAGAVTDDFFPASIEVAAAVLPDLELDRVFVLTGADSCSATERFINGLRGVGVEVVQIGATTCGNPFILTAAENCGVIYSAITGRVLNAQGWGGYDGGFAPGQAAGPAGPIPGCAVNDDDLLHDLGDPDETRLAAALTWRATGTRPTL